MPKLDDLKFFRSSYTSTPSPHNLLQTNPTLFPLPSSLLGAPAGDSNDPIRDRDSLDAMQCDSPAEDKDGDVLMNDSKGTSSIGGGSPPNRADIFNNRLTRDTPCELADILEIVHRDECHWRVKTSGLVLAQTICTRASNPEDLWRCFLKEGILPVFNAGSQQGMLTIAVRSMTLGLKQHPHLLAELVNDAGASPFLQPPRDLASGTSTPPDAGGKQPEGTSATADDGKLLPSAEEEPPTPMANFFSTAAQILPRLHHDKLQGVKGGDPTAGSVENLRNLSFGLLWPVQWNRFAGQHYFAMMNVLWWQQVRVFFPAVLLSRLVHGKN